MNRRRIELTLSIIAALIMLQTLFFKFSGAPESVYIFSQIGLEPGGRYGVGAAELIASVLILIPAYRVLGALLSIGLMAGAVYFHTLGGLGIEVEGDGGKLFWLCIAVLVSSSVIFFLRYQDLIQFIRRR